MQIKRFPGPSCLLWLGPHFSVPLLSSSHSHRPLYRWAGRRVSGPREQRFPRSGCICDLDPFLGSSPLPQYFWVGRRISGTQGQNLPIYYGLLWQGLFFLFNQPLLVFLGGAESLRSCEIKKFPAPGPPVATGLPAHFSFLLGNQLTQSQRKERVLLLAAYFCWGSQLVPLVSGIRLIRCCLRNSHLIWGEGQIYQIFCC